VYIVVPLRLKRPSSIAVLFFKRLPFTDPLSKEDFLPSCDENISIHDLIAMQHLLAQSGEKYEQVMCRLWVVGTLRARLKHLTDRQCGQLLFDYVWNDLRYFSPAMAICEEAKRRLMRSEVGGPESAQEFLPIPTDCPKCGMEMIFSYGIEEPDFLECLSTNCKYRMNCDTNQP
jgi:hypothetical protein